MKQKGEITLLLLMFSALLSAAVATVTVKYHETHCQTKDKIHCEDR